MAHFLMYSKFIGHHLLLFSNSYDIWTLFFIILQLEKSLHAMHSELEEIQCESKAKLVQAREMVVDFEQRNLITESALQEANVFLEEQNKSCGDAQRKLKELEAIEDALQKQHQSFDSEYVLHSSHLAE
jgi:hypothetical protein